MDYIKYVKEAINIINFASDKIQSNSLTYYRNRVIDLATSRLIAKEYQKIIKVRYYHGVDPYTVDKVVPGRVLADKEASIKRKIKKLVEDPSNGFLKILENNVREGREAIARENWRRV